MSRPRLIFVIFFLTAILIITVSSRTTSRRIFYRYRSAYVARKRLRQQLCEKQLTLAAMTTPGEISERLKIYAETDR